MLQSARSPGMDDKSLIAGYLAGESESHRQVGRWIDEVLRSRHLGLGAEREDAAQEGHRRLLISFREGHFEGRAALRTYVWRVAQSVAIDHLRARARRPTLPLDDLPEPVAERERPEQPLEQAEQRRLFGAVLDEMGEECRRLWALAVFEELPYAAIAARLGISEGNARVRALRCRSRAAEIYRRLVTPPAGARPSVQVKVS